MKNHEKSSVFSAVHRNVAAHKGAVHKDSQNALEDARFSATEPQIKKNFRCAAIWLGGRPPQTPPRGVLRYYAHKKRIICVIEKVKNRKKREITMNTMNF
jgi:hypothetical protein